MWVQFGVVLILTQACSAAEPDVTVRVSYPPLSLLAVNGWGDMPVETFCLEVDETYKEVLPETTPFADVIKGTLTRGYRGFDRDGSEVMYAVARIVETDCDATIRIDIKGEALMGNYMNVGGLYTGWDISGTITLSADGKDPLVVEVATHQEPPSSTHADRTSAGYPSDAIRNAAHDPLDDSWSNRFVDLFTCSLDRCLNLI
jgi:hypothetical protein